MRTRTTKVLAVLKKQPRLALEKTDAETLNVYRGTNY